MNQSEQRKFAEKVLNLDLADMSYKKIALALKESGQRKLAEKILGRDLGDMTRNEIARALKESEQRAFAEKVLGRDLGDMCYKAIARTLNESDIDKLLAEMHRLPPEVAAEWSFWALYECKKLNTKQEDALYIFVYHPNNSATIWGKGLTSIR